MTFAFAMTLAVQQSVVLACDDVPPGKNPPHTCAEHKAWQDCSKDWMAGSCCNSCHGCNAGCVPKAPSEYVPSDPAATDESRALMFFLGQLSHSDSFIFGHHNANYMGQHWEDPDCTKGASDAQLAVGQHPGLFEYNFHWIANAKGKAKDLLPHVRHAASVGALVEFHFEADNPVTGGDAHDLSGNPIVELLPSGMNGSKGKGHARWKAWLNQFADFAKEVGTPLIFRPFHEATGGWFWWGSKSSTAAEYRHAWQWTVSYLRETKHVHNVLYAYAPSKPSDDPEASYGVTGNSMYPGNEYVDIACFDHYGTKDDFHVDLLDSCRISTAFASTHGKVPAICEVGRHGGSENLDTAAATWWDKHFLGPVRSDESCKRTAFALTWANRSPESYWVPLQTQASYEGFKNFHQNSGTLFAGDFSLPYHVSKNTTLV